MQQGPPSTSTCLTQHRSDVANWKPFCISFQPEHSQRSDMHRSSVVLLKWLDVGYMQTFCTIFTIQK